MLRIGIVNSLWIEELGEVQWPLFVAITGLDQEVKFLLSVPFSEESFRVLPNDPTGGTIGSTQYTTWRSHFGQTAGSGSFASENVPEPASGLLLLFTAAGITLQRRGAVLSASKLVQRDTL